MADYKELDEALGLVEALCTADQVRSLLRRRKGDEGVRITSENKQDLVRRNLRDAIGAKAIRLGEVFDLIRASEENGDQHVFYYKPRSKKLADILSLEHVAKQLWGARSETVLAEFPAIRVRPNTYVHSDLHSFSKKPKDWLLKIYGNSVVTRFTGKVEQRGPNVFWREYVEEPLRIVIVVRWNSPDLLEIRVQRNESRGRIQEWEQKAWEMLKPALVGTQFDAWELTKTMERLILKQQQHEDLYTFRDASILDSKGVHANFHTDADDGNLFESTQARDSIQEFMEAHSNCRGLTVTWLAKPDSAPEKEIRTLLGAKGPNEMIVFGRCLTGDLDHVTNQLRRFSRSLS